MTSLVRLEEAASEQRRCYAEYRKTWYHRADSRTTPPVSLLKRTRNSSTIVNQQHTVTALRAKAAFLSAPAWRRGGKAMRSAT